MNKAKLFTNFIHQYNDPQGVSAVPLFLNLAALSGLALKKTVGAEYSGFLFYFKNRYGEMNYDPADFKNIWQAINQRLKANPAYLKNLEWNYQKVFRKYDSTFKKITQDELKKLTSRQLLKIFHTCAQAQINSVGIAHILEAVSVEAPKELKLLLSKKFNNRILADKYFFELTAPSQPSFLKQEELELYKIRRLGVRRQALELRRHQQKYFWLLCSYLGPREATITFFKKRMSELPKISLPFKKPRKPKVSGKILQLSKIINFCAAWQDERKIKILTAIYKLGKIIAELSQRAQVAAEYIYYLKTDEALQLQSPYELTKLFPKLKQRSKGCFYFINRHSNQTFDGAGFKALEQIYGALRKPRNYLKEFSGTSANRGQFTGRVKVCKDISKLSKVANGDVLVASMTRPEYMPALKKAGAIITDEGGITSHAAIISRELGIPCIIGTKIATKILKDGDLVEVDAIAGTIKILKRYAK